METHNLSNLHFLSDLDFSKLKLTLHTEKRREKIRILLFDKKGMFGYILIGLILGAIVGYLIFYFRYEHKDTVGELRANLKEANKQVTFLQDELEEYLQQNDLLREKAAELLDEKDQLSDVVAELSKYYVHIKKAAEKTTELTKFLNDPDPDMEEKIQQYASHPKKKDKEGKAFF